MHLICVNFDMRRRGGGADYEVHIADLKARLQRLLDGKNGLIEK